MRSSVPCGCRTQLDAEPTLLHVTVSLRDQSRSTWFRAVRSLRPSADGKLVEGRNGHDAYDHCQRELPRGQREQGDARRRVRRRTAAPAADAELHAVDQSPILSLWELRRSESEGPERGAGTTARQGDPTEVHRFEEAFPYFESNDRARDSRQRDKLREELTLARVC